MLIGVKKRFVFIANSKTASTSIEKFLAPYAEIARSDSPRRKHAPWIEVVQEYGFLFDQSEYAPDTFFKFGVIRDPVDWACSWFNYRYANAGVEHPIPAGTDFRTWWEDRKDWVHNIRQTGRFAGPHGEMAMNVLIPLEDLAEAMSLICRKLNIQARELPYKNKSKKARAQLEIPEDLLAAVQAHYAEDFAVYEFWKRSWREQIT